MLRVVIIGLISLSQSGIVWAQELDDNRRCKTITTNSVLTIEEPFVPNSLNAVDSIGNLFKVELVSTSSIRVVSDKVSLVEVCYRVLPKELTKPIRLVNLEKYRFFAAFRNVKVAENPLFSKRDQLFGMGELNHGGQITRGITVGSSQDLFVNSSLNLSLDGKLSDDLYIRASITDQFIPYQPEGNTQQLQDFDNVFVELYNDHFSVIGGDVIYKNKETHFLKYKKNVQGGAVSVNFDKSKTGLGLSAAKGQFASVDVEVNEGMQGPYKVPSNNGDQFVIIIANSEKVFLDGRQLNRGFDNDYIIDYNQAEITFTSNTVITKYSRIRVDYEYSSRYYSRSIMNVNHSQQVGKLNILASYYRESDNRNNPLLYNLSEEDKRLLESVGNNTDSAVIISAAKVPFSEDKILYELADTVSEDLKIYKIFKYTTSFSDSLYSVSFSEVGNGTGSYIIKDYLAQGRIYEWVGQGKGNFEPYRKLIAPTRKEMVDLKLSLDIGEYSQVYIESAISNQDANLFSDKDSENNSGYALKTGYRLNDKPLVILGDAKFSFFTDLEYLNQDFKAIDRFRRVEFNRDWGYQQIDSVKAADFVMRSGVSLSKNAINRISYGFNYRQKENQLSGYQHKLQLSKSLGKLQVNVNGLLMNSNSTVGVSSWNKLNTDVYLRGRVEPGYRFILQRNTLKTNQDSIVSSANYFSSHEFYLRTSSKLKTKFELAYVIREDRTPYLGEMITADNSNNVRLKLGQNFENGHVVGVVFNYRLLAGQALGEEALESISGRVDWSGDLIKNVFRHELNYSVANVRVPRREYVFVEVPTGEGTHTWRDDNMDGIKDLDEFYEAIHFDERNYAKIFVNTTEFTDAYENVLSYRANLKMPRSWRGKGGILNLLSRMSNTTSWSSNYRTTEDNISARLIPFLADIDETQVLSLREALRSTFFINKSNPRFGMSFGYAQFRKKYLYSNGYEGRSDQEVNASVRWSIARKYNFKLSSIQATRLNRSDYLDGRNYDIQEYRIGPSFSWQPKPTFRVTSGYSVGLKMSSNSVEIPTTSSLNEIITEIKIGRASKFSINANVKYSKLQYDGDELTPLGYEMLQGLRPGDNLSWLVGWQQKLIAGLQLNIFYEGRKPDDRQVIHSGRASVSALF